LLESAGSYGFKSIFLCGDRRFMPQRLAGRWL
jgi:hypothetical protein